MSTVIEWSCVSSFVPSSAAAKRHLLSRPKDRAKGGKLCQHRAFRANFPCKNGPAGVMCSPVMADDGSFSSEEAVKQLHRNGDWKGVIRLYEEGFVDRKILWFQPDSHFLDFLGRVLDSLSVRGVSSIGCGTGLLEWLIQSSTGLPVVGYEIDQGWWESKYSPPRFLSRMECIDPSTTPELDPEHALLFCYFSDLRAFEGYLQSFAGRCIILIGPDVGNNERYCDPPPFYMKDRRPWSIYDVCRNAFKDAVVVYVR